MGMAYILKVTIASRYQMLGMLRSFMTESDFLNIPSDTEALQLYPGSILDWSLSHGISLFSLVKRTLLSYPFFFFFLLHAPSMYSCLV